MLSEKRQSRGVTRLASTLMLCMAALMLLGFSNPDDLPTVIDEASWTLTQTDSLARADTEIVQDRTPIDRIKTPGPRPSSFVPASAVLTHSILGGVNSRRWFDARVYSPDRVITSLHTKSVGEFHSIGFPDIRTYRKKNRRHNPLKPQPWARMVSWRKSDARSKAEPIAHVRCMGLSPQEVARRADRYSQLILDYSMKYEISASLIKAVISVESCFNNKALSRVGAQGLMQLMPRTASWLNVTDPHDPAENLKAGIRYLAALREQFETLELALAAYNAGPGNVRRYGGVPPFSETRAYVRKVQANYRRYSAATLLASR